jgi:hypothetical protein
MLVDALLQVARHTCVENGAVLVRQDVDEVLLAHAHEIASLRNDNAKTVIARSEATKQSPLRGRSKRKEIASLRSQ